MHANAGAVSPRPFRHERRDQAVWSSCSCERLFIGLGRAADDARTLPHRRCTREPIRKTYDDTCTCTCACACACDMHITHTRAATEQTGRRDPTAAPRRLAARASQRAVAHLAPHRELRPTRAAAEQTGRHDPTAALRRLVTRASGEKRWLTFASTESRGPHARRPIGRRDPTAAPRRLVTRQRVGEKRWHTLASTESRGPHTAPPAVVVAVGCCPRRVASCICCC
eukprot:scaffold87971_cov66-Phaeocystis_antarctica.AAC.2